MINDLNQYAHIETVKERKLKIEKMKNDIARKIRESIFTSAYEPKKIVKRKPQKININRFSNTLTRNAKKHSTQKCAKNVRLALEAAGAKFQSHPIAAADWGVNLEKVGYKEINPTFNHPKKGDIYIIPKSKAHKYGHIAGFTGNEWISDFHQASYAVYSGNYRYKYYRQI